MPNRYNNTVAEIPFPVGVYDNAVGGGIERETRTRHSYYEDMSMGELVDRCVQFEREVEEIRDRFYQKDRELDSALHLLRGRL